MNTFTTSFEKTCDHCHGEGHTECQTCHGKGTEECPTCHGKKEVICEECHGHGKFNYCNRCGSTGRRDCGRCGGSGRVREVCLNCGGGGNIRKTRLRNCGRCHGTGMDDGYSCNLCGGTGQKEESYYETCPTCGGSGKGYEVTCPDCKGKGTFTCSRCHGTGHAKCSECSGTGKVMCEQCDGEGVITCRDCHGGGDHVCVECYGTGDKLPVLENKNVKKVDTAIEFYKKKEYVNAFLTFREAVVKHNNAAALRRLGGMYERGEAVYKNQERANLLYCAAANAGDVAALFYLGKNYLEGVGVGADKKANYSEAKRLLELATVKGHTDAEPEYKKVAKAKLVKHALSGVVGWRGKFEIPQFLLDADPAADQKDKDEKEAARKAEEARREAARKAEEAAKKAEEARKEREWKRKNRNIHLCRCLWWFLFRVAAAGAFFTCFKDSYENIPDEAIILFVAWFFVFSYLIRPRFGGARCFYIGLAAAIVPVYINSTDPMISFCLFTVMVTFFMRWMGEKLKFPLITYPLVGAMVGFCTSPFSISHNVFKSTSSWWCSSLGLTILFFWVNKKMSRNNGNGVAVEGERETSWRGTFYLLALCGLVSWYIFASATGEQRKYKWQVDEKNKAIKSDERKLSMYEQGVHFRDGGSVPKNIEMAKKMFGAVISSDVNEQDVVNAEIAMGKILIGEGNAEEALKHLKSAARKGNAEAYFLLGQMLQKSGKMDSAIKLYQTAADREFVGAMMVLGQYYSEKTGFLGGRRDNDLAVKYYTMAAHRGNAEAQEKLKEL